MKHGTTTMIALLFLFVFVFSLAATMTAEVTAGSGKCLGCCYRPPDDNCSALYGQYISGVGCTCLVYLCLPTSCTIKCRVCY